MQRYREEKENMVQSGTLVAQCEWKIKGEGGWGGRDKDGEIRTG